MGFDATARRRWLGASALVLALAMVLAGETVLKGRLGALAWLLYWLSCLVLTCLAMVAALLDLRALRRRGRDEQRQLLQETLQNIQTEAKTRPRSRSPTRKAR